MYCEKCGFANRQNSQFCGNCGNNLSGTNNLQPTPSFQKVFFDSWRSFASSPFTLILAIVFSLYLFLFGKELASVFADIISGRDALTALLKQIPKLSKNDSDTALTLAFLQITLEPLFNSLIINLSIQFLFDIVTLVGIWKLYLDNHKTDTLTTPIRTACVRVLKTRFVISMALNILSFASELILYIYSAIVIDTGASGFGTLLTMVVFYIILIQYNKHWIKFLSSVTNTLQTSIPDIKYITLPSISLWLIGILLTIVLLFISEPSLLFICAAINPILFAVLLHRYKSMMRNLQGLQQPQQAPLQFLSE